MMDYDKIKAGVRLILEGIGEDITREGLLETPDLGRHFLLDLRPSGKYIHRSGQLAQARNTAIRHIADMRLSEQDRDLDSAGDISGTAGLAGPLPGYGKGPFRSPCRHWRP